MGNGNEPSSVARRLTPEAIRLARAEKSSREPMRNGVTRLMSSETELALTLLKLGRSSKVVGPEPTPGLERKEGIMSFTKAAIAMGSSIGVRELIKTIERFRLDGALAALGLEKRPSTLAQVFPAAGLIAVSAAVGAGVALLLAPTSGRKLRARLSDGIDDAKHRLSDSISHYESAPAHPHSIS